MASTETRRMVLAAAAACEDKKAEDTRILELDPMDSGFTDFFIITSGSNERQTVAISDEIEARLKRDFGVYPHSVEGRRLGEWVLLDYFDFVVHIFLTEKRAFYDIERLRKSARTIAIADLDAELVERVKAARQGKSAAAGQPAKAAKKAASKVPGEASKSAPKKAAARKAAPEKAAKAAPKKAAPKKAAAGS
ncbi:MAG TPA: ribosome silencing factor [Acidisarcina sp.]